MWAAAGTHHKPTDILRLSSCPIGLAMRTMVFSAAKWPSAVSASWFPTIKIRDRSIWKSKNTQA